MIKSGGFLGRPLGPLLKTGLPLIKNVIRPLANSVLVPLWLTTAASAADAGIHKKILGSDRRYSFPSASHNHSSSATLIILNDEMEDIIKIVRPLEDSGLLLKGVGGTVQNEAREQKGGFLSMLFGTFWASLLGNILAGRGMNRAGEEIARAGYVSRFLKAASLNFSKNKKKDH